MDFAAKRLGPKVRSYLPDRSRLSLAMVTLAAVFLVLLVAQVVFDVPKELVLLLGGTFLAWTAVYWLLSRRTHTTPLKHLARWLLPWGVAIALFLGTVYVVDRAGWLWFRFTGYDVTLAESFPDQIDVAPEAFVAANPQFELDADGGGLLLPAGEHVFTTTTIVPQGTTLTIAPGAVLRFGAGRSLISYSPVVAQGTEDAPIRFVARHPLLKWGVVGVVQGGRSVFEYVHFENSRQALVNDVDFFAGLSLIETDSVVRNSTFQDAFGKDAMNARESVVQVQNNTFRNAYKDCLDLDGGAGEISANLFVNCEDEGIDLSLNDAVMVFGNTILDSRGGRLAADQNQADIEAQNTFGYSDTEE